MVNAYEVEKDRELMNLRAANHAMDLDSEIKRLTTALDADKNYLREHALGETIAVPGKGKVQVKNGCEFRKGGEKVVSYTFSAEKFKEMSPAQRGKLLELGVVTVNHTVTPDRPAGTPSVVFTHNK